MTRELIISENGPLGCITLNRPAALNALTWPMISGLTAQIADFTQRPEIQAIVLMAVPGKAFCAGGDVRALYEAGKAQALDSAQFFNEEYALNLAIGTAKKPIIALMDGITMGGGVGIGLHAQFPIASEKFIFAMPETAIGFFPDIGASFLLNRCPKGYGMYLGLSGARLDAQAALSLGLIKGIIASDKMGAFLTAVQNADWSEKPATQVIADTVRPFLQAPEQVDFPALLPHAFTQDSVEAILAALEADKGAWAADTCRMLHEKSPLSLKITYNQLKKAHGLTLAACLRMDAIVARHFMQTADFYEGVRALLVDKDKRPCWQPASLSLVTDAMVDAFFHP